MSVFYLHKKRITAYHSKLVEEVKCFGSAALRQHRDGELATRPVAVGAGAAAVGSQQHEVGSVGPRDDVIERVTEAGATWQLKPAQRLLAQDLGAKLA